MVDQDSKARIKELEEVLGKHRAAREEAKRERETIAAKKRRIERERNSAFTAYDTGVSFYRVGERTRTCIPHARDRKSSRANEIPATP